MILINDENIEKYSITSGQFKWNINFQSPISGMTAAILRKDQLMTLSKRVGGINIVN